MFVRKNAARLVTEVMEATNNVPAAVAVVPLSAVRTETLRQVPTVEH